jgi:hypothetical protein
VTVTTSILVTRAESELRSVREARKKGAANRSSDATCRLRAAVAVRGVTGLRSCVERRRSGGTPDTSNDGIAVPNVVGADRDGQRGTRMIVVPRRWQQWD